MFQYEPAAAMPDYAQIHRLGDHLLVLVVHA
jgi:hypothetical protein